MLRFKIFFRYTAFWIFFALCFTVMFAFLSAAVIGVTAGLMLAVLGTAIIMFKASFIISELAPELMLFGGLCGAFFTAFLGVSAIKLGFVVSRMFLRVRRRCDRLREGYHREQVPLVPDEHNDENMDEHADENIGEHADDNIDEHADDNIDEHSDDNIDEHTDDNIDKQID